MFLLWMAADMLRSDELHSLEALAELEERADVATKPERVEVTTPVVQT
jgi:hypothetical protein